MNNAKFIIQVGTSDFYVVQSPDIRFTDGEEEALRMGQELALETLDTLMTMQRTSGMKPDRYMLHCVEK
jgi:hypothetical protein